MKSVALISAAAIWPSFAGAVTSTSRHLAPSMSNAILDKDGKNLNVAAFKGMPVLINFWATWCPPCVAELPGLNRAADKLSGLLEILLISVDRGGSKKALPFLHSKSIKHPHLAFDAKGALSREMGVRGLPTSFLLDADQRYCWTFLGPREWADAEIIAELQLLLEG